MDLWFFQDWSPSFEQESESKYLNRAKRLASLWVQSWTDPIPDTLNIFFTKFNSFSKWCSFKKW